MAALNFKHLRYFWMVAKTGSIAAAAAQLHLTPHSISGQLSEFERSLGSKLLRRKGRNLELSEAGRRIVGYADEIFGLSDALMGALAEERTNMITPLRVGIADSVPKSIAYRLLEPALQLSESVRLICHEGRLTALLAELSIHKLDMVIADRAMPSNLSIRGFSHPLGESAMTIFGTEKLLKTLKSKTKFPKNLEGAPFLLPGEDFALRTKLSQWLDDHKLHPLVRGEFDDSALMKAFGQAGVGFFPAPSAQEQHICSQYHVRAVGRIDSVRLQIYAITTERRITHPAILAIRNAARQDVFQEMSNKSGLDATRTQTLLEPNDS